MMDACDDIQVVGADLIDDIAFFRYDTKTDRSIYSPAALKLHGIQTAPNLNNFFDMVHPEDRLRVQAKATSVMETPGTRSLEYRIVRPDGSARHLFCQVTVQFSSAGQLDTVRGLFFDITKDGLFAPQVAPNVADCFGFYDFDVSQKTSLWSPELQRLLGTETPIMTAREIANWTHPDDRAMVAQVVETLLQSPGRFEFCFRVVSSDGKTRWVQDRGEVHGPLDPITGRAARVTGTLTDITDSMEEADKNSATHTAFWNLIDRAPFGVYAIDADFRIVRVSQGGLAAFEGISPLLGADLGDVLRQMWPDPFASEAIGHFRRTLATGVPYRAKPLVEERNDRNVVESYDWGVDRIRLEDGRYGAVCHFYDLSERVRHETALKEREQRLALAYEATDMGAWELNIATGEVIWTSQLFRMFGSSDNNPEAVELWRRVIHPDDFAAVERAFEGAIQGGPPFDVDCRIVLPSGEVRYIATKGELIHGSDGQPERMIGVTIDITLRKMAEMALRDSEQRLKRILDSTVAFVGVLKPDGILHEVNKPALDASNLARADVIGKPFWETFWWSYDPAVAARMKEAFATAQSGQEIKYDAVVRIREDTLITIEFMLSPVYEEDGSLGMIVASGFDISDREKARAHAQSLMGEINHRTKNILTLVQVIARQTARGGADDFVERFEKRITALANAQDILVKSTEDRADLRDLAQSQLGHFQDAPNARIHMAGPAIGLAPHAAQAVGMALHELATNASKYGALSNDRGRVEILWHVEGTGETGQMFRISWTERDGPPVQAPDNKGFGSTVIRQMIEVILGAEVSLDFDPEGVQWRLSCPLSALETPN